MNLTEKNLFKYIEDYSKNVDEFIKNKNFNEKIFGELVSEFDSIASFLMIANTTPAEVCDFLSAETLKEDAEIPEEYSKIKSVFKLKNYVTEICKDKMQQALKEKKYSEVLKYLSVAVKADIKNVVMIEDITDLYMDSELYSNLIELYRVCFVYTINPMYFEKIGDVYLTEEKYQEAIDSYLNCAETTDDYAQIYEKLAKVFGLVNDNDSRLACLEHIKLMGGENVG